MTRLMKSIPLFFSGLLTACSHQVNVKPYDQYLGLAPAGAMNLAASSTKLQPFIRMFSDLSSESVSSNIDDVYASELYFNDTFHTFQSREEIKTYFLNMADKAETKVEALDYAEAGQDVWLRWRMSTKFDVMWKSLDITTIGMTHFRFNDAGKIVVHQDYWDGVEGFYAHLPVIGGVITYIRSGLGG